MSETTAEMVRNIRLTVLEDVRVRLITYIENREEFDDFSIMDAIQIVAQMKKELGE